MTHAALTSIERSPETATAAALDDLAAYAAKLDTDATAYRRRIHEAAEDVFDRAVRDIIEATDAIADAELLDSYCCGACSAVVESITERAGVAVAVAIASLSVALASAPDLDELHEACLAAAEVEDALCTASDELREPWREWLAQRCAFLVQELPAWGDEPDRLDGVWSFDDDRLLVGAGPLIEWTLEKRDD